MNDAASEISDYAARLLGGDVAAGARVIRWLDDADPRGPSVLSAISAHTGRAHVVGVTGPPGAGKSTLTNCLIGELRSRGYRVGVLAIDPSSPFTGGAILGDRVRMSQHTLDPDVFIRSIGTRGQGGGLSRSTHDACQVMDAMGYQLILVETVGVGQDEIDVVALAHSTVIVGVPGLGDEVQAVKAGLMEAGDIFVINKADRDGFDAVWRQFELMLHLRDEARRRSGSAEETSLSDWTPPLLSAIANLNKGAKEIVDAVESHRHALEDSGEFAHRTRHRLRAQFYTLIREAVLKEVHAAFVDEDMHRLETGEWDPYTAAMHALNNWRRQAGGSPL